MVAVITREEAEARRAQRAACRSRSGTRLAGERPRLMLVPGGLAGSSAARAVAEAPLVAPRAVSLPAVSLPAVSPRAVSSPALSRAGAAVPLAADPFGRHVPRAVPLRSVAAPAPITARAFRVAVQYRRIIACCLLALATVAGLWMVMRAIGGVAGGGPLTSSGAPATASATATASASASAGASQSGIGAAAGAHPVQGQVWIVRPGDTVWGIVEAAGFKGDPRPVVDELSAQLGGRALQVGEAIAVP